MQREITLDLLHGPAVLKNEKAFSMPTQIVCSVVVHVLTLQWQAAIDPVLALSET